MAGIYIHIPFCRRACHYCDFHFSTNLKRTEELVDAILLETDLRKGYLDSQVINTIYFGGGTPSLLPTSSLNSILDRIQKHHSISANAEITLEANPEDLSVQKLTELKSMGINRLSLGTQSFIDAELQWMNRMHTSEKAKTCIAQAQQLGFDNISIDLIFGLPDQTEKDWLYNLEMAISLNIQHISSYALTVEERTVLNRQIQNKEEKAADENSSTRFFEMNLQILPDHGFEHYEVSNFSKPEFISKHNSSYWKNEQYLGLGPSAHSFNGHSRQWNIRSNAAYMANLKNGKPFSEMEQLSVNDRLNEHILTGLRTKWGIEKKILEQIEIGSWEKIKQRSRKLGEMYFNESNTCITLTQKGKLLTDRLSSDLFF